MKWVGIQSVKSGEIPPWYAGSGKESDDLRKSQK